MSTGDQTAYLRGKMAVRRKMLDYGGPGGQWSSPPQFIKDGFQKWAESSTPAREGGAEKTPSMKATPKEMRGGDVLSDAADFVNKMSTFYEKVKESTPVVKGILRNKGAQNLASRAFGKTIVPVMEDVAKYMEKVGLGHMKHDEDMVRRVGGSKSFKDWCKEESKEESHGGVVPVDFVDRMKDKAREGGRIGMGMDGGRIGMGDLSEVQKKIKASLKSTDEDMKARAKEMAKMLKLTGTGRIRKGGDETTFQKLTKYAKQVYDFLKDNKEDIHDLLEAPMLNDKLPKTMGGPTQIPKQIAGALKSVGLGRPRKGKGEKEEMLSRAAAMRRAKEAEAEAEKEEMLSRVAAMRKAKEGEKEEMLSRVAAMRKGKGDKSAYMSGGMGRDDAQQFFSPALLSNGYKPQARLNNLAPDSEGGWGVEENPSKKGGRKPSAYAMFVKEFAKKHPGPHLMKRAGEAWKSRK
jgi:hypothetical protein